jgi:hypothetical protein
MIDLLGDDLLRRTMGERGQQQVEHEFTFAKQSVAYQQLFERLIQKSQVPKVPTSDVPQHHNNCLSYLR